MANKSTTIDKTILIPRVKPELSTKQRRLPSGISYMLLGFLTLTIIDLAARITYPFWPLDRFNSPNRSWIWWTVKDFRNLPNAPDIVLMGSSLMMAALHGSDATYFGVPQNVALHHRCAYLEKLLQDKLKTTASVFAFAIGGQMSSDAYAIAHTLLTNKQRPKILIYGIAPRDLMDNSLSSPASTETFRYMSKIGNLASIAWEARTSFWEQLEYMLSQISFLYNKRSDFIYLQNRYARNLLGKIFTGSNFEEVHAPFHLRKIAMLSLPEDNGPNELLITPYQASITPYIDNLAEYKFRYRTIDKKVLNLQLAFLDKLLKHCHNEGIQLILVNMPLTKENVELMPTGSYSLYRTSIRTLAKQYKASYYDLNEPRLFPKNYFADSVHLNGQGGMKFFEILLDKLSALLRR